MNFEKLGNIVDIKKGKKPNITDSPNENSVRVIQIEDLRNNNSLKFTNDNNGVYATKEDILLAWDGANAGTIGYGIEGYIGSTIALLRKKNPLAYNTDYIGSFLKTKFIFLRQRATGATIPHIDRVSLENLLLPVIEISEQIRIASILEKTEKLISQRKESIALLDELIKGKFYEMFGDPVKNEKGWEIASLSQLGSLDRGVSKHRPRNAPQLLGGPYPLIQTGEVSNANLYITNYTQTYSEIGLKQSKLWKSGTLLITIAANIAKTAILTFDACFPDSVVGFIPKKEECNTIYVHFLFSFFQKILEKNAPQAAQKNINLDLLRNLQVPKTPLSLQNKFAEIVNKVELLREQYNKSLKEMENLYDSLSQKAFKGELDWGAKEEFNYAEEKELDKVSKNAIKKIVIEFFTNKEFLYEELYSKILDNETLQELEYDRIKNYIFKSLAGKENLRLRQAIKQLINPTNDIEETKIFLIKQR